MELAISALYCNLIQVLDSVDCDVLDSRSDSETPSSAFPTYTLLLMKTKRNKSVSVRVTRAQAILGDQPVVRHVKIYRNASGRIGSSTSHKVLPHAVDPPTSNAPSLDDDVELGDLCEPNLQEDSRIGEDSGLEEVSYQIRSPPVRPHAFFPNLFLSYDPVSTYSGLATSSTVVP